MNIPPFTLNRQNLEIGTEIQNAVSNVLESGKYIGGYEVNKFEDAFSSLIGTQHAITCNSGTDALVLALRALDIGIGDEVITSSFSFFATAEAISLVGANPVFVDIDPSTFLLDIKQIEININSRTKAIMPVHLFGNAVDMSAIQSIAQKYNLKIIEDCAQATCTKWDNKYVGSLGDIGCFSFFPTKNLGAAGDGGAITTSNASLAQKIRELAVHGSPKRYSHNLIGYNSRLDAIQASILNIKIKYITKWIEARKRIANIYLDLFEDNQLLVLPQINTNLSEHTWNQFVLRFKNNNFSIKENPAELFETDFSLKRSLRNYMKIELMQKGINSIIYYPIPIHCQMAYKANNFDRKKLIDTERICTEVLSLPMFPEIKLEEQIYIAENLNTTLRTFNKQIQISA
tara:strand:+ start:14526 stop:15731 length:1206 start_codon:yes stop_codon:yes gene_type:complete